MPKWNHTTTSFIHFTSKILISSSPRCLWTDAIWCDCLRISGLACEYNLTATNVYHRLFLTTRKKCMTFAMWGILWSVSYTCKTVSLLLELNTWCTFTFLTLQTCSSACFCSCYSNHAIWLFERSRWANLLTLNELPPLICHFSDCEKCLKASRISSSITWSSWGPRRKKLLSISQASFGNLLVFGKRFGAIA